MCSRMINTMAISILGLTLMLCHSVLGQTELKPIQTTSYMNTVSKSVDAIYSNDSCRHIPPLPGESTKTESTTIMDKKVQEKRISTASAIRECFYGKPVFHCGISQMFAGVWLPDTHPPTFRNMMNVQPND